MLALILVVTTFFEVDNYSVEAATTSARISDLVYERDTNYVSITLNEYGYYRTRGLQDKDFKHIVLTDGVNKKAITLNAYGYYVSAGKRAGTPVSTVLTELMGDTVQASISTSLIVVADATQLATGKVVAPANVNSFKVLTIE